jgi:hypothetical protein
MKQKKCRMVLGTFLFFILTNCVTPQLTVFTEKDRASLMYEQLKKVQYYVDEDILLSCELNTSEVPVVSSGKVIYTNGKRFEEIFIPKNTPGELITVSRLNFGGTEAECFGICFEASKNDRDKILWFRPGNLRNIYVDGYYLINFGAGEGEVKYGDKIYNVTITDEDGNISSNWPYLLFERSDTRKDSNSKHDVGGRKIQ